MPSPWGPCQVSDPMPGPCGWGGGGRGSLADRVNPPHPTHPRNKLRNMFKKKIQKKNFSYYFSIFFFANFFFQNYFFCQTLFWTREVDPPPPRQTPPPQRRTPKRQTPEVGGAGGTPLAVMQEDFLVLHAFVGYLFGENSYLNAFSMLWGTS